MPNDDNDDPNLQPFKDEGFYILVKAGDVVDTGSGPPSAVPIATSMWVPKGSTLNGSLIKENSEM